MSEEDGRGCTPGWPLRLWIQLLLGLCVLFLGTGCGKSIGRVVSPTDGLPGSGAVPGWTPSGKTETFTPDTLFDLMDGQAEAFFVYGFEKAATSTYAGPGNRSLRVEIYRLATPADAYGLFTVSTGGEPAAATDRTNRWLASGAELSLGTNDLGHIELVETTLG
jgi:hypothetical protein